MAGLTTRVTLPQVAVLALAVLASVISLLAVHHMTSVAREIVAEKLASVGKLAASVAHGIRNPLTSLKMRLFSLRQELGSDPQWDDDLRVVSEEIARLESVVRNFLEFARPPALRLTPCRPAPSNESVAARPSTWGRGCACWGDAGPLP
ncbi:MAG: histidine kinase dimerization/phospho-acceptor domain-containing protein [Candidatus Latescibacterota bacterium]